MAAYSVVVCGGGIAGAEALLRLHRLGGDGVQITLVSPNDVVVYRPSAVLSPFTGEPVRAFPIQDLVTHCGARWIHDSLDWVDRDNHTVHTAAGQAIPFDALVLAIGGREAPAPAHTTVITDRNARTLYGEIIDGVDRGELRAITFLAPSGASWPMPLYELAFLTAKRSRDRGIDVELSMVIGDMHPLAAFGEQAASTVADRLAQAGIRLFTGARANIAGPHELTVEPHGVTLHPDRIVSVPRIIGPNVRGIPGDGRDRFLHIDPLGRVQGTDGHIFAAGDATDMPVKHGGIGAQQADTVAAAIAHLAGLAGPAPLLRPVIRGTVLTGDEPLYLSAYLIAGRGWQAEQYEHPPWSDSDLIVADELSRYLASSGPTSSGPTSA